MKMILEQIQRAPTNRK